MLRRRRWCPRRTAPRWPRSSPRRESRCNRRRSARSGGRAARLDPVRAHRDLGAHVRKRSAKADVALDARARRRPARAPGRRRWRPRPGNTTPTRRRLRRQCGPASDVGAGRRHAKRCGDPPVATGTPKRAISASVISTYGLRDQLAVDLDTRSPCARAAAAPSAGAVRNWLDTSPRTETRSPGCKPRRGRWRSGGKPSRPR